MKRITYAFAACCSLLFLAQCDTIARRVLESSQQEDENKSILSMGRGPVSENDAVDSLYRVSVGYSDNGNYEDAWAVLDVAMEMEPENAHLHEYTGELYMREGDQASALISFHDALSRDSTLFIACNNIGIILMRANKYHEALPYIKKGLLLAPPDTPNRWAMYLNRSLAYYVAGGHYYEALADLDTAIAMNPELSREQASYRRDLLQVIEMHEANQER